MLFFVVLFGFIAVAYALHRIARAIEDLPHRLEEQRRLRPAPSDSEHADETVVT